MALANGEERNLLKCVKTPLLALSFLLFCIRCTEAADADLDGLDDIVETGTGVYLSPSNTGTKPSMRDSDGDGVADGLEVFEKTNPNSALSFNAFSEGLVGYYQLNGSGFDLSANAHSATKYVADATSDRYGATDSAVRLNGINQFIEVNDSPVFRELGAQATISFWCYPEEQGGSAYIISKAAWAGQQWAVFYGYSGSDSLQFFCSEGPNLPASLSQPVSVKAGRWTHCAVVLDGAKCRIYLNGFPAGTSDLTVIPPPVYGTEIRFGGTRNFVGSPVSQFRGSLDDIRIYSRPLSGSQVTSLYRFESADRDGDGIVDSYETGTGNFVSPQDTGTSPENRDSDGDGISDGEEINVTQTDPNRRDTDGDGFDDLFEIETGFNPNLAINTPETTSSIRTAVEFRFNAAAGSRYRVEASDDLTDWKIVESGIDGTGTTVRRLFSVEGTNKRYFRARRE